MKLSKKIFKKIKGKGKYNKGVSLSKLAEEYYGDMFCKSWSRKLFKKEMEQKFGHHLTLKKRLERKGHSNCKPLTPSMIGTIQERLGEP